MHHVARRALKAPHPTSGSLAQSHLQDDVRDNLKIYADCSVLPALGSATATCTALETGVRRTCRLPFPESSTVTKLAGLHLAADLLLERGHWDTAAVLTNSRPALFQVLEADMPMSHSGHVEHSLVAKKHMVTSRGCEVKLHWLPFHCGIKGIEEADSLARGAHDPPTPLCTAISALD